MVCYFIIGGILSLVGLVCGIVALCRSHHKQGYVEGVNCVFMEGLAKSKPSGEYLDWVRTMLKQNADIAKTLMLLSNQAVEAIDQLKEATKEKTH